MPSKNLIAVVRQYLELAKAANTGDDYTAALVTAGTDAIELAFSEVQQLDDLFRRGHEEHARAVEVVKQQHETEQELRFRLMLAAGYIEEIGDENTRLKRHQREADQRVRDLETHLKAEQRARRKLAERLDALPDGQLEPAPTNIADEVERLAEQLSVVQEDRDLYADLLEQAEQERNDAVRDRARLAATLSEIQADQGALEVATVTAVDLPAPNTFAEVLEQAAHPLLVLTLDPAAAAALDSHPNAPAWRRRTADALATLAAYATEVAETRAGSRSRRPELANLLTYVRKGGPEVTIAAGMVALGESRGVTSGPNAQARVFSVPTDVHPDGRVAMFTHLRIGGVRPPAVRLHLHDDTDGSGKIVCGYLGPHLPTSRTN